MQAGAQPGAVHPDTPVATSAHAIQQLRAVEASTHRRHSRGAGAPCAAWKASGRGVLRGAPPGGHGSTAAAHTNGMSQP